MDSSSEEESEWTNEFDKSFKDQLNQYKYLYLEKRTKFREEKQELENTIKHVRSQNSTHQKGIQMRDKEIESVKEESEKKQKEQEEIIQNLSSANLDLLKKQNQFLKDIIVAYQSFTMVNTWTMLSLKMRLTVASKLCWKPLI